MRSNLKEARREAGYSQRKIAKLLEVSQSTYSSWELGKSGIDACYIPKIREVLKNRNANLFDTVLPMQTGQGQALTAPIDPTEGTDMDKTRRLIITSTLASSSLIAISPTLVLGPTIDPVDFLDVCEMSMPLYWSWFRTIDPTTDLQLETVFTKIVPILKRLAWSIHPMQERAAKLFFELKVMQMNFVTAHTKFDTTRAYALEALEATRFISDPNFQQLGTFWLSNSYSFCFGEYERSMSLLQEIEHPTADLRPWIESDRALVYAARGDETNAKKSIEQARLCLPSDNASPLFHYSEADLQQKEGKAYLLLAEVSSAQSLARLARNTFEEALSQPASTHRYHLQLKIRYADSLRLLGERQACLQQLTRAEQSAKTRFRLTQIAGVINRCPASWFKEDTALSLKQRVESRSTS